MRAHDVRLHPRNGQRFCVKDGALVFTVAGFRHGVVLFAADGEPELRQIHRDRWQELFDEGTLEARE